MKKEDLCFKVGKKMEEGDQSIDLLNELDKFQLGDGGINIILQVI